MESNGSEFHNTSTHSGMRTRAAIVVVLVLSVGAALYLKRQEPAAVASPAVVAETTSAQAPPQPSIPERKAQLPRLVDLGARQCIPCRMMAPILEGLKQDYKDKFDVVFIDVWQNEEEAVKYGVEIIPTQIFFDAAGKEQFRHVGFFSKEDILAKWKEIGVQ